MLCYLCIDAMLIKIGMYSIQTELVEKPCALSQAGLCVKAEYRKMTYTLFKQIGRKVLGNKLGISKLKTKNILTSPRESRNRARHIIIANSNELIKI